MDGAFNLALHALVCLSHSGGAMSSEELSKNICTNPVRVRRVMSGLRRAGLVDTRQGQEGGYSLAVPASEISLAELARAVDADFVSCAWHSGREDSDCPICSGMAGLMDGLYARLNSLCSGYLEGINVSDIERNLFSGKGA